MSQVSASVARAVNHSFPFSGQAQTLSANVNLARLGELHAAIACLTDVTAAASRPRHVECDNMHYVNWQLVDLRFGGQPAPAVACKSHRRRLRLSCTLEKTCETATRDFHY
jgi:hypothetical protein